MSFQKEKYPYLHPFPVPCQFLLLYRCFKVTCVELWYFLKVYRFSKIYWSLVTNVSFLQQKVTMEIFTAIFWRSLWIISHFSRQVLVKNYGRAGSVPQRFNKWRCSLWKTDYIGFVLNTDDRHAWFKDLDVIWVLGISTHKA